jgi:alpha-2-macroglobulin
VVSAIAATPNADRALVAGLLETLWTRVHVLARNGQPAFAGLVDYESDPLILPSETRSLAEVARAVALATPEEPRLALLRSGLVSLGGADGWGSTNADAAALRALAASWDVAAGDVAVTVSLADGPHQVALGHAVPMARWRTTQAGPIRVTDGGTRAVLALQQARYVPAAPGWQATQVQNGFVLSRGLLRVPGGGAPMVALTPAADGTLHLANGDVVEEIAELVNPEQRTMVAVVLPIAAGLEPLNPDLATAPAEAAPSAGPTLAPTYAAFGDDAVLYVYEALPAGTYQFRFRANAGTDGSFTEPPGTAEMMYRGEVNGASAGARLVIGP